MREQAVEIEIPKSGISNLARVVLQRWNAAVMFRSQERVGKSNLSTVLVECYDQYNGILTAEDQAMIDLIGGDYYVNLSELKSTTLNSILTDMLINSNDLPFVVSPTPIPELSKEMELEVLDRVKNQMFNSGMLQNPQGSIMPMIRSMKEQVMIESIKQSEYASGKMMRLIKDQCVEGNFYPSMTKFLEDFSVYPFAVMHGPVPVMKPVQKWVGNKIKTTMELSYEFYPTSVFDFFYAPDCETAQNGAGVFVRQRISKQQLYQCADMKSYIRENVLDILERSVVGDISLSWTSQNKEQPRIIGNALWGNGATLEVLKHYGVFSGRELQEFNITGIDDNQFYEATVSIIEDKVIQVFVNPNPHNAIRPVYTASYDTSGSRIPGRSICQKVRDVERAYTASLRMLMANAGFAVAPISEVDIARIGKYIKPEDIGKMVPATVYPVGEDPRGGGRPAFYFHDVPNNVNGYMNLMRFFMDIADNFTQLPAALHGQPVGTGANRTFRGMAMLYGNAMKPIQKGLTNMDHNVFKHLGTLMYNMNMMYHDDPTIRGDAKVHAQGATGLLQKEVAKQTAFDTLQLVATAGSAAQGMVDPRAVKWAVDSALKASGVPMEVFEEQMQQALPTDQGQQMPPEQGEIPQ